MTVFAAASTQEVVEAVGDRFKDETGTPVRCSPAASSVLARQIEEGADADLFLSADERWADYLEQRGLVARRRDLLGNRLVVITPADSPLKVRGLMDLASEDVHKLALALDSVPAGRYARDALKAGRVWDRVRDRVVEGGSVREVLALVARREAEAGLVYATDAALSDRVRVAFEVDETLHQPIRYPLVLVRRSREKQAAQRFFDYLGGENAAQVFRRAGFTVLP